jgi:hypothetical protein
MLDKSIIANERTIKLALQASERFYPIDRERVRIIKRVLKTKEADMQTILKYRDSNITDKNSRKKGDE